MSSCNIQDRVRNTLIDKNIIRETEIGSKIYIIPNAVEFNKFNAKITQKLLSEYNIDSDELLMYMTRKGGVQHLSWNNDLLDKIQSVESEKEFQYDTFVNSQLQTEQELFDKTNFSKYISYKKQLIADIDGRLLKIQSLKDPSNLKEYKDLLKQEELLMKLKYAAKDDIKRILENKKSLELLLGAKAELDYADKLLDSGDPNLVQFAKGIIEFYQMMNLQGARSNLELEHPLFSKDEIIDKDGNILLPSEMVESINQIVNIANKLSSKLDQRNRERFKLLIEDSQSGKLFEEATGEELNILKLLSMGASDIGLIDSLVMDVTTTLGSNNLVDVTTKIAHKIYSDEYQKHNVFAQEVNKRLTDVNKNVENRLKDGGFVKTGLFKLFKVVDYSVFFEKDEQGFRTNNIIRAFTSKFFNAKESVDSKYESDLEKYRTGDRNISILRKIRQRRKKWYIENTEAINAAKLPEIELNPNLYGDSKIDYTQEEKDAERERLIQKVGINTYNRIVKEQQALINEYELTYETKPNDEKKKSFVTFNNPIQYVENSDTLSRNTLLYDLKYVSFIPKEEINTTDEFGTPQRRPSGYYNSFFMDLYKEENKPLLELYNIIEDVINYAEQIGDPNLKAKLGDFSLMRIEKSMIEIWTDENLTFLAKIFAFVRESYERALLKLGRSPRQNMSQIKINPYTGKPIYEVSTGWLQTNEQLAKQQTSTYMFKLVELIHNVSDEKLPDIYEGRYNVDISENIPLQNELAHLLGYTDISQANWISLTSVNLYDEVYRAVLNNMVMDQSFDLPRILAMYADCLTIHHTKNIVLSDMAIIRNFYAEIPKQTNRKTRNVEQKDDEPITYEEGVGIRTTEVRENAVKKFDSWFYSEILGIDYGDNINVFENVKNKIPNGLKNVLDKLNPDRRTKIHNLSEVDENSGRAIYEDLTGRSHKQFIMTRDKEYREDIYKSIEYVNKLKRKAEKAIEDELYESEEELELLQLRQKQYATAEKQLIDNRDNLGTIFSIKAVWDLLLNAVRFIGLGFNFVSSINNFLEGQIANYITASTNRYITKKSLLRANRIVWQSTLKCASFGKLQTPNASKVRILMDRFDVLQDMTNEFRRSKTKSVYSKINQVLNPYNFTQRTEYNNQFPIMVAMLMDTEIIGKDGTKSSVWDAMDTTGRLKENFRTQENLNTWENLSDQKYLDFQSKLTQTIVQIHGDYSKTRGNRSNYHELMRAIMMFKRWLPRHIEQRYGATQYDVDSKVMKKGRFRSLNAGTAGFYLFALSTIPFGFGVGAMTGVFGSLIYNASGLADSKASKTGNILGDMFAMAIDLAKATMNLPVEFVLGKSLFKKTQGGKLAKIDEQNYAAIISELSIAVMLGGIMALMKSLLAPDDDDDEDELLAKQKKNNLFSNIIMQQLTQLAMYINLSATYDQVFEKPGPIRYLKNLREFGLATFDHIDGKKDLYLSGPQSGKYKSEVYFDRVFMPSLFRGNFGFESMLEREYNDWAFSDYFIPEDEKIESSLKLDKALLKKRIKDDNSLFNSEKDELLKRIDTIYRKDPKETRKEQEERIDNYLKDNPNIKESEDIKRSEIMKKYGPESYRDRVRKENIKKKRKSRRKKKRK